MPRIPFIPLSLALLLSSGAGAHDGESHPAAPRLPLADADAPVATEVASVNEEQRARNYFTDLAVQNQSGQKLRFYSDLLQGRTVLINFVYTNCDNGCPLITEQLAQVKDKLGERFGREIFFISISTDPERDSPAALQAFAEKLKVVHPGWQFLTGAKADIDRIITRLGQYSPEPEDHSTLLLAGNLNTRHWIKLRPTAPLLALTYRLNELADEQPGS